MSQKSQKTKPGQEVFQWQQQIQNKIIQSLFNKSAQSYKEEVNLKKETMGN